MKSKTEFDRICNEIYLRHCIFFNASNTRVKNYIDTDNGEIKFYPGIVPDIEIYKDIKLSFQIKDLQCDETYPKK